MGSGNIVHNLRQFDFRDPTPLAWASRCDAEIRAHVVAGRHDALMVYPQRTTRGALPCRRPSTTCRCCTRLHCNNPANAAEFFNDTVQGSISMTSVLIGGPAEA